MKALLSIINIFIGIFIMLIFMFAVQLFCSGLLASYINVIGLAIGLTYICFALGLRNILELRYVIGFILLSCFITLFCIAFSSHFVFKDLIGLTDEISNHEEHNWTYMNLRMIADSIVSGNNIFDTLERLHLRQYEKVYTYSSLLFVFSGPEPTNICIWNGMHLSVFSVLALLIATKLGIRERRTLRFIIFLVLLQPSYDSLHIYGRDIIGEAFLLLGFYIFICLYKKPFVSLVLLPIYGFLFYSYRMQYLPVAVLLSVWAFLKNIKNVYSFYITIILLILSFVIAFRLNTMEIMMDDLNYYSYLGKYVEQQYSITRSILLGFVGYFPWTNIMTDDNWSYHIFLCPQTMLNNAVLIVLLMSYKGRYKEIFYNPACLFGLVLYSFGYAGGGAHVKYYSVGTPLFLLGIDFNKRKLVIYLYIVLVVLAFFASIVYNMLGLTGSQLI